MNRKSDRQKLIDKMLSLLREILITERGNKCELCGRNGDILPYKLSLFHILPRSRYPRLMFNQYNLLLACWVPYLNGNFCHNIYHHECKDDPRYEKIANRIIELRGKNYRNALLIADKIETKHTIGYLNILYGILKQSLKTLYEQKMR